MRKDEKKRIQLRPDSAECIDLVKEYLHPSYELKSEAAADAGETGLLALFHLKSKAPELPSFRGRWDMKENAVDIDLLGGANESKVFKAGKDGYRGHHSTTLEDGRYQIDVAIPSHDVFRAVLEFDARGIAELQPENVKLKITDSFRILDTDSGEEIAAG